MLSAPAEAVACRPAAASSTACSPFAAPSWCSAVHAAAPSPPPPPTSAPAAVFAAGLRSATLPIAGSVALNRRVSLSFHGTCPTLLLSAASSHARLPKAHGAMLVVGHSPEMSEGIQTTSGNWWKTLLLDRVAELRQREDQIVLVVALVIGALTGLAVVAFIVLTERLGMRLYPVGGAPWRRLLLPVVGSLGIGYLLYRYFPNARGSGVPQTKAALFAREGRITLRTALGKFFCTSATLASGIPLGREGPSVQVGSGIASVLGRLLGLRTEQVKKLIPVGSAAAIAAAFNTPLAAVLFSLEEIMGDLHAPVMGAVVLASATSWMVLRVFLGNHPLFKVPQYQLVHPLEFVVYAVLGVAGGVISVAFTKLLPGMRARFLRFPQNTVWFQPVAGGLMVGLMGWFVPQVLGVGYGFVGDALNGRMAFNLMVLLVVLKLIAVTTSYASGNAGGIFGPSLFIGAMLGGTVGTVAHHLFPAYTATPGAYALVGMGAAFAGIVRAPRTSVLMIDRK